MRDLFELIELRAHPFAHTHHTQIRHHSARHGTAWKRNI